MTQEEFYKKWIPISNQEEFLADIRSLTRTVAHSVARNANKGTKFHDFMKEIYAESEPEDVALMRKLFKENLLRQIKK